MASTDLKRKARSSGVWWLVPLGIWALSALVIGALVLGWLVVPANPPTFHLFFSDFAHMKVWLATAVVVLACGQLLWAARMFGLVRFPPREAFYQAVHRSAGRLVILLTLPIAYHCLILVGARPMDMRILLHTVQGTFLYGAFATKVFLVRTSGLPGWLLPVAGGALFLVLLGLWLTSVPWFITNYGLSL